VYEYELGKQDEVLASDFAEAVVPDVY